MSQIIDVSSVNYSDVVISIDNDFECSLLLLSQNML